MTLRKILAISELLLACAFGLGILIFFVSMSNISTPTWQLQFFLYWGAMTSGPLLLVIGASLTLFDVALKRAAMSNGARFRDSLLLGCIPGNRSLRGNGPQVTR
jgi:hypothetical protein